MELREDAAGEKENRLGVRGSSLYIPRFCRERGNCKDFIITVSFYNIEMSFSVFDEELRIPITRVVKEFAKNW